MEDQGFCQLVRFHGPHGSSLAVGAGVQILRPSIGVAYKGTGGSRADDDTVGTTPLCCVLQEPSKFSSNILYFDDPCTFAGGEGELHNGGNQSSTVNRFTYDSGSS